MNALLDTLNFDPKCDKNAIGQLVVTAVAALAFAGLAGGYTLAGFFFVALASVLCSYVLKGYLAPATGFWNHFPSKFSLSILFMLFLASAMTLPLAGWLFVVGAGSVFGLGFGRSAVKLFAI